MNNSNQTVPILHRPPSHVNHCLYKYLHKMARCGLFLRSPQMAKSPLNLMARETALIAAADGAAFLKRQVLWIGRHRRQREAEKCRDAFRPFGRTALHRKV